MTLRPLLLAGLFCGLVGTSQAAATHACASAALKQADALLRLHADNDARMEIEQTVKVLPSLKNPVNSKQRFDVLEVWGFIYKGQYRMRFIYAQMPGDCMLMGQEVLEHASL